MRSARNGKVPRKAVQLALAHVSNVVVPRVRWGGKRANAGAKRAPGKRESVAHRKREPHVGRFPVHITLRASSRLPSLRQERIRGMIRSILFGQRLRRYAAAFQIVEFSIQNDHLHLMVEAVGEQAHDELRSGISGFAISFAKRLNAMLGRKGKVWADRWHGRQLRSPTEVKYILGYIFRNFVHHGELVIKSWDVSVADLLSSGDSFDGWSKPIVRFYPDEPWPDRTARTWMLGTGWRRLGLLDPDTILRRYPNDVSPPDYYPSGRQRGSWSRESAGGRRDDAYPQGLHDRRR